MATLPKCDRPMKPNTRTTIRTTKQANKEKQIALVGCCVQVDTKGAGDGEDEDVRRERDRVLGGATAGDLEAPDATETCKDTVQVRPTTCVLSGPL